MKEYSVSALLNDVIDIIKMKVKDTTIRFVVSVDSNLPAKLIGEESEISKILLTFLGNAVSSSANGFISLFIFGKPIDKSSLELVIDVTCSGCKEQIISIQQSFNSNLPLAFVSNSDKKNVLIYERREVYVNSLIFTIDNLDIDHTLVVNNDEFYEKMESRYFNYLFIAYKMYKENKEIIDAYKDKVKTIIIAKLNEAVTEPDLISINMPVYCKTIAEILNEDATGFIAPDAKVLIVDDVNINLQVVKVMLAPYKLQIDLCYNGNDAIKAAKENDYDIIFMDYMMPEMNGIEALKQIRVLDDHNKEVPVIALSGNISDDSNKMFIENGFNDYISKPVSPDAINTTLVKWIPKEKQKLL